MSKSESSKNDELSKDDKSFEQRYQEQLQETMAADKKISDLLNALKQKNTAQLEEIERDKKHKATTKIDVDDLEIQSFIEEVELANERQETAEHNLELTNSQQKLEEMEKIVADLSKKNEESILASQQWEDGKGARKTASQLEDIEIERNISIAQKQQKHLDKATKALLGKAKQVTELQQKLLASKKTNAEQLKTSALDIQKLTKQHEQDQKMIAELLQQREQQSQTQPPVQTDGLFTKILNAVKKVGKALANVVKTAYQKTAQFVGLVDNKDKNIDTKSSNKLPKQENKSQQSTAPSKKHTKNQKRQNTMSSKRGTKSEKIIHGKHTKTVLEKESKKRFTSISR